MTYKVSYYFQLFDGKENEPAVAINTLTGGSYSFDKSIIDDVKKCLNNPDMFENSEMHNFLLNENILIRDDFDELNYLKSKHRTARYSSDELYITYSMTNACNFRCTYCYQEHKKDVLSDEKLEKTFRFIERELVSYKSLKVHWFGGEPLLRLPWVLESSNKLRQICDGFGKGYFSGITTNGSLFTTDAAAKLFGSGVSQIQFTLDGARSIHDKLRIYKNGKGSYHKVIDAIQVAIRFNFSIFVRINLSPMNANTLTELLEDFEANGINSGNTMVYINEMKQHSNSSSDNGLYFASVVEFADSMIECLAVLKKFGYSLPRLMPVAVNCEFDKPSSVLFGADGDMYHCTTGTDKALGKIDDDGVIVEKTERRSVIHSREPWDDEDCASCKSLPTCMGGCAYLDEEKKVKCNPERFVIEKLLRLNLN